MKLYNINKRKYDNKVYILIIILILLILTVLLISIYKKRKENFNNNNENNNNKTYIICKKTEYHYMEDYILSFYKKLNAENIVFNDLTDIPDINKTDIFIFVQTISDEILQKITNENDNIYLINTEQLTRDGDYKRMNSFPKNIKMLDYSKSNMKYYNGYYTKFLSYQINYDEIYNLPKTKDICIMSGESDNRRHIINQITDKGKNIGVNIDIISGWKKERDEKLFTYKILLNISHNKDYKIFESLRCDRCIFNRMIVISDKKEDMDLYYLKDYMIFEDYDKIADKAIEVLNNYNMYYKTLGLDTLELEKLPIEPVSL